MLRRVLIIGKNESFIVKGMEMKLEEIDVSWRFSPAKIKSLEDMGEYADIYILYMDETIEATPDVLVYINDLCKEVDRKIFLIGTKTECANAGKYISEGAIEESFERPVDMKVFVERIEDYLDEAAIEARKKSILIVDDDVTYMRVIMEWLKDDYRVSMVNSGVQAIAWLAKNKADLILLDYEMPVTPGPQVLEMLHSEAFTDSIPVMFLTGKSDRKSIVNVLSLHPADYLLKSIDRKGLKEKIENFFMMKRI